MVSDLKWTDRALEDYDKLLEYYTRSGVKK